jgi:hypothetical protein
MTRIIAGMKVHAYEMMAPALSGTKPASCGIQNPNLGRTQGAGVSYRTPSRDTGWEQCPSKIKWWRNVAGGLRGDERI